MKKVHELEVKAFSQLGTAQRYNYFVAKVFEWQEAWGLYDEGWIVAEIDNKPVFPLWPAEAFAKLCLIDNWQQAQPKKILLTELTQELLPSLVNDEVSVAVFMVPHSNQTGVLPAQALLDDFITLSNQKK